MIGDSGQDVVAVKQRLYELGYVDTEDGGFDEAMEAGVKEFQAANNLSVDGKVGRNTKEALYNPECVPKAFNIGDSGDNILLYQNRLQKTRLSHNGARRHLRNRYSDGGSQVPRAEFAYCGRLSRTYHEGYADER